MLEEELQAREGVKKTLNAVMKEKWETIKVMNISYRYILNSRKLLKEVNRMNVVLETYKCETRNSASD